MAWGGGWGGSGGWGELATDPDKRCAHCQHRHPSSHQPLHSTLLPLGCSPAHDGRITLPPPSKDLHHRCDLPAHELYRTLGTSQHAHPPTRLTYQLRGPAVSLSRCQPTRLRRASACWRRSFLTTLPDKLHSHMTGSNSPLRRLLHALPYTRCRPSCALVLGEFAAKGPLE